MRPDDQYPTPTWGDTAALMALTVASMIAVLLLLGGCGTVPEQYVEADRQTYEAIAPDYRDYVEADEELDEDQVERRVRLLDSWEARIEAAEAELEER